MATVYFALYLFWALPNSIAITRTPMRKEDWVEVAAVCCMSCVLATLLSLLLLHAVTV